GSILDVLLAHDVPLEHACGGNCACTTCHVVVTRGFDGLSEASEEEEDLLDRAVGLTPTSRLGCQAVLPDDADVEVTIPRFTVNQLPGPHGGWAAPPHRPHRRPPPGPPPPLPSHRGGPAGVRAGTVRPAAASRRPAPAAHARLLDRVVARAARRPRAVPRSGARRPRLGLSLRARHRSVAHVDGALGELLALACPRRPAGLRRRPGPRPAPQ